MPKIAENGAVPKLVGGFFAAVAEVVVGIFKGVDPVDGDEDRNAGGIRGGGGVERVERGDKTGEGVEGQGSAQDKNAEVR